MITQIKNQVTQIKNMRMTADVALNEMKGLEILRYAQNDVRRVRNDTLCQIAELVPNKVRNLAPRLLLPMFIGIAMTPREGLAMTKGSAD